MHSGNYQDNVTIPLSCEHDYDATAGDKNNEITADLDANADAASCSVATTQPAMSRLTKP